MINNQFNIIGTCISEPIAVNSPNIEVKQHMFIVEVDKYNGNPYTMNVYYYDNSKSVNIKGSIKGRVVAISGILEGYNSKSGVNYVRCVAQGIYFPLKKTSHQDSYVEDELPY